jgi:hypothetical protein
MASSRQGQTHRIVAAAVASYSALPERCLPAPVQRHGWMLFMSRNGSRRIAPKLTHLRERCRAVQAAAVLQDQIRVAVESGFAVTAAGCSDAGEPAETGVGPEVRPNERGLVPEVAIGERHAAAGFARPQFCRVAERLAGEQRQLLDLARVERSAHAGRGCPPRPRRPPPSRHDRRYVTTAEHAQTSTSCRSFTRAGRSSKRFWPQMRECRLRLHCHGHP